MPLPCLRCLGACVVRLDANRAPVTCPTCHGSGVEDIDELEDAGPWPAPPPEFAARAGDPSLPAFERALAVVIAGGAGRFILSDYLTVSAILAVGVPLPPMTVEDLDALALAWLEEARAMRRRCDFVPLHLLRDAERTAPPALRRWAQAVIDRALAGG